MQVYFKPKRNRWQFWKRERFLKEGKDFTLSNGMLKMSKHFVGEFEVTYQVKSQ